MNRDKAKKLLINTAIAGMIAGAGFGCSRSSNQTESTPDAAPTAVTKNGCGGKNGCSGKNGCQGATAEGKAQAAPEKSSDTNSCRATGDRKAAGKDGKGAKNSCAGKAGCA